MNPFFRFFTSGFNVLYLYFSLWLLLSSSASAILDVNENGASDIWEKQYNFGNLYPNFDPNADPDGDGWSNAHEAGAGTDPSDGNPPTGFIRPEIEHIPAVYQSPEENGGEPTLASPEAIRIQWPTLVGKTYTLLTSVDLSAQSWIAYGGPRIGTGSILGAAIALSQPDGSIPPAAFLRVAIGDIDLDGDTLTNAEEHAVGSSSYFADTNGNGIPDERESRFGNNPSADTADENGDGVPDNIFYSVEFEVTQESHITDSVGHEALTGTDNLHRYLTRKVSEEYSISGSPSYSDIQDGKWVEITSYIKNGISQGHLSTHTEGITRADSYSAHQLPPLASNEGLEFDPKQTVVTAPAITATENVTTTTITTPWKIKRNVPGQPNTVLRSGTEITTDTYRRKLSDRVTSQELWTNYFKQIPWTENNVASVILHGPRGPGFSQAIVGLGEVKAAELLRDFFKYGDFDISGTINKPTFHRIDYSPTNFHHHVWDVRLKSLRWRWVRFDPRKPFDYEYAAPPDSYQKTFRLLVQQENTTYLQPGFIPATDETIPKGIIQIECKGSNGTGWHTVPSSKYAIHRVEEPAGFATLDFVKSGASKVTFGNLPQVFRGYTHRDNLATVGVVKGNHVQEKEREMIGDPNDSTGFKTEAKFELNIAQLSHRYLFDANNNHTFDHDEFKNAPDAFRIRLPGEIAPPTGSTEHRIKIWTVDADGVTVDTGAEVDLNVLADFHETAALCLVTDDQTDDAFAVEGKTDGALGDRTYRAVLGGSVNVQWLTFPGTGAKPIFEIPIPIKKTVTAKGFNVNGSTTTAAATAYFERAKLALSSCGVKLEYTVVDVPEPEGVSFGSLFEFTLPKFEGDIAIEMTTESKALMDGCPPPTGVIPVYFVRNFSEGFIGWGNAPSLMAATDSAYGGAIFLDSPMLSESTLAHEFLHILLDASHGAVDPLWNHEHTSRPWCLWHTHSALPPIENGISARRRITDSMRTRILKSTYCN